MSAATKSLVEFLRKPEWIAAIALLIQAVILFLQAVILRRHGATMEEHAGIAKAQAETAALIGKALDQQGKILAEQTKIMDEQFKFQRTIELKAERVQVFDALMRLHVSFKALLSTLSEVQLSNYTQAMQDRVRSASDARRPFAMHKGNPHIHPHESAGKGLFHGLCSRRS